MYTFKSELKLNEMSKKFREASKEGPRFRLFKQKVTFVYYYTICPLVSKSLSA